jgi:uncharacterized protein YgiM (DUF1202 family)
MRIRLKVMLLMFFFLAGLASLTVLAGDQKLMSVEVKEGQLRAKPSFLGKIVAMLSYGDRVAVLEEQAGWMRVSLERDSNVTGWIHTSALTKKTIELKAGSEVAQVSDSEVVIAGKGFTSQVEQEFKLANQNLDYTWIDKMEKEFVVSQNKIQQFLTAGGLVSEGGAQ